MSKLRQWVSFYKEPVKVSVPWGAHGAALTIFPFIFFFGGVEKPSEKAWAHEMVHWKEQRRAWPLWFVSYLLLAPFYGFGPRHPMERYAYTVETLDQA